VQGRTSARPRPVRHGHFACNYLNCGRMFARWRAAEINKSNIIAEKIEKNKKIIYIELIK
jgi:hypothetical protein